MGLHDDPVATLVARLQASGFDPQSTGPTPWKSRCPAHNGRRHNLCVKKGDDGQACVSVTMPQVRLWPPSWPPSG